VWSFVPHLGLKSNKKMKKCGFRPLMPAFPPQMKQRCGMRGAASGRY
jgi:hypothetical protein